jgi:hypothetical protein
MEHPKTHGHRCLSCKGKLKCGKKECFGKRWAYCNGCCPPERVEIERQRRILSN